MLKAKFGQFKIVRVLFNKIDYDEINELKKKFSYIFVVIYKKKTEIEEKSLPGFSIQARQSAIIDLRLDIEEIFQKFDSNTRKEIRRAQREKGLSFVKIDTNFHAIYKCYKKFEFARGWVPTPYSEMKQHLFFTAYYKGKVISGVTCYGHKDVLRVGKIFSIRHRGQRQVKDAILGFTSRNLIFEICKYTKQYGYRWLDLGGVDFSHPDKKGIARFKMKFGSEIVDTTICRFMTPSFALVKKIGFFFRRDIT